MPKGRAYCCCSPVSGGLILVRARRSSLGASDRPRAHTSHLYPLSLEDVAATYRATPPQTALEEMLSHGMYPLVHTLESVAEKEEYLYDCVNSNLHRDLLAFEAVKKPRKVVDLLVLLAHQIGKEVSVSGLAKSYLDVLGKMFVGVNVRGFCRNLRKEVTRTSRYHFADVGLRNALIDPLLRPSEPARRRRRPDRS